MRTLTPGDVRGLRQFGIGLAILIVILFVLVAPWLLDRARPEWPWWSAAALLTFALAWPRGLYPVYRVWVPMARFLGWLNTWLILGFVFFALVVPFGLYARLARKLHYEIGFDPAATTYRKRRSGAGPVTDLRKPY